MADREVTAQQLRDAANRQPVGDHRTNLLELADQADDAGGTLHQDTTTGTYTRPDGAPVN